MITCICNSVHITAIVVVAVNVLAVVIIQLYELSISTHRQFLRQRVKIGMPILQVNCTTIPRTLLQHQRGNLYGLLALCARNPKVVVQREWQTSTVNIVAGGVFLFVMQQRRGGVRQVHYFVDKPGTCIPAVAIGVVITSVVDQVAEASTNATSIIINNSYVLDTVLDDAHIVHKEHCHGVCTHYELASVGQRALAMPQHLASR